MTQVRTAKEHWGEDIPDWVLVLATECEGNSQNQIANKLKISATTVSLTLRAKYTGDMQKIEELVRGVYMSGRVDCPALGTVEAHVCHEWRRKARDFSPTNANRVRMFKACANCPRNQREGK